MAGHILIADHVATNRIILKVKLASASYDVSQAETAQELIACARNVQPDLILIDSGLTDIDCLETCKHLKSHPKTTSIPIIILTGDYTPDHRLAALRAGAEEILPKPVEEPVLLSRVRNLLRIRNEHEELLRRQGTAADFGFHEAPAGFAPCPNIVLVEDPVQPAPKWADDLPQHFAGSVTRTSDRHALQDIAKRAETVDAVILLQDGAAQKSTLTLLAELRSRPETRHAAILATGNPAGTGTDISALDIGANDLLGPDSTTEEVALRIGRQLQRRTTAAQLRATLDDGLRLAVTDPLTGLFNRRYAMPHCEKIAARAARKKMPFALMVLDLDYFKSINDQYGHSAGDAVLKEVARRLRHNLRSVDLLARIGGEEFLVVMPDTDLAQAQIAAERLRRVVGADPVMTPNSEKAVSVTMSIGYAMGGDGETDEFNLNAIFDSADQALMGSKTHGRNLVTFGPVPN